MKKALQRRIWKSVLFMLLACGICLGMLNVTAFAGGEIPEPSTDTSGTCGDNLTWELESDGTLRIRGTGEMADFAHTSWYYRDDIKKVVIENGVTSINDEAFQECVNLKEVTIPVGVTQIGYKAFEGCKSLQTIAIPASVKEIDYRAFFACSSLGEISVHSANEAYKSEDGILFSKDGAELIVCPAGK